MTHSGGPIVPRRYGDREIARILERATELQRAEPSAADPTGLTIDELAEIAREAGIDADVLRRAASEVDRRSEAAGLGDRLAGAPLVVRIERIVEGEVPAEQLDAIIPLIQHATEGQGTASAVGRTLTWSSYGGEHGSVQQVLVACQDGRTLIRWEERFTGMATGLFGGLVAGGGIGGGVGIGAGVAAATGSELLILGIPTLIVGGCYLIARAIFATTVRKREARANRVVDEIAAYVEGVASGPRA